MKTWQQFVEAKAQLAPMDQQPPEYQQGYVPPAVSARRKAMLAPMNQQPATAGTGGMGAPQGPAYGTPASDEDMGAQYAKSMQVQQAMAAAQRARQNRGV